MKSGWKTRSFEDCIEKVSYTSKIQRKDFLDAGTFPIVSQEDAFINGYWDNENDLFRVKSPIIIFGDHTKILKYVDFDFVLGADGVKLLPPKDFLVPKFFYYQLQTAQLDTLGYARHYKLLKELEIKYPDKKEQQRIVTILDQAFDGIATAKANAEKNLKNAREIFESHLNAVFTQRGEGWVEKRLDQVTSIINGVAFKSENFSPAGEAKCIKITNFGVREFVCVPDGGLPLEFESKYSTVAVPSGSIVIALTRTIISSGLKVAIVPTEYHNALLNQRVAAILPIRDGISIAFLFAYLSTRDVFNYVSERVNTLMQLNLSINELRAMPIPIPSTQQQEMLTEQLSSIVRDPTFRIHLSAKAHSS